jgi:hypothetical protein
VKSLSAFVFRFSAIRNKRLQPRIWNLSENEIVMVIYNFAKGVKQQRGENILMFR